MSKLKEQLPAVFVTVLLIGVLVGGYAFYVNASLIPAMEAKHEADLKARDEAHAKALADANEQTRKQIDAVNALLKDAIQKREADMFRTDAEVAKLNADKVDQLAEAIAKKVQPFNPLPKTPEEAERAQNEQVDKVSSRLKEKIDPILTQMASDQHLTRDKIDDYSKQISAQINNTLNSELAKNQQLNNNLQTTQSLTRESLMLSHEMSALYLSSLKDQGFLTRILTLPANVIRDVAQFNVLTSDEKKKKEEELMAKMNDLQGRLDAVQAQNPGK